MTYSASHPIPTKMLNTIENCAAGLGLVGTVGGAIGPGADLIAIVPTWAAMVCVLADQAGTHMDDATAKKVTAAVATGAIAFVGGTKVAASVLGWLAAIPSAGLSLLASAAANAAINAKFTHAYGKACALYFLQSRGPATTDVVVAILLALTATQFGLPSGRSDVVA